MAYEVPGMTLIPQTSSNTCWYASAQMLIRWRRDRDQQCTGDIIDPSEDAKARRVKDADGRIYNPEILEFAKRLGLRAVPPMSPTKEALAAWFMRYGPLWVNGTSHIVVLAGILGDYVKVYDPSPINEGAVNWRSLEYWYAGNSADSRDTGADVTAVFLHCPA